MCGFDFNSYKYRSRDGSRFGSPKARQPKPQTIVSPKSPNNPKARDNQASPETTLIASLTPTAKPQDLMPYTL